MVRHSAQMRNRFAIGQDGKTVWKRLWGKEFKREEAEFGASVIYLEANTKGKDKFDTIGKEGIWLGVRDE